jgi:hypothetical protein
MSLLVSLLYQLKLKKNKMKKIINVSTIFYNLRRALYAMMVIVLAVSIPLLSWIELSHSEEQSEKKTEVSKSNIIAKGSTTMVLFQKQS